MPSAPTRKSAATVIEKKEMSEKAMHELELDENGVVKATDEFKKNVAALRATLGDDLAAKEEDRLPSQHPWL